MKYLIIIGEFFMFISLCIVMGVLTSAALATTMGLIFGDSWKDLGELLSYPATVAAVALFTECLVGSKEK